MAVVAIDARIFYKRVIVKIFHQILVAQPSMRAQTYDQNSRKLYTSAAFPNRGGQFDVDSSPMPTVITEKIRW